MVDLLSKYSAKFPDITSLYDYQSKVLEMLLQRKNTLAIIPTGGGKSLLYQLLSLELEGITIVISPLLALMEEQVTELNVKRNISALALNSNLSFTEQREILRNLNNTKCKLIYMSPERLQNPFFRAALIASGIKIPMIVIDEAHCISQWGGNFRPDYGQIYDFVSFLEDNGHKPFLLCLTATLSQLARKDIIEEFKVPESNVYVTPKVIRDNLKLNFKKVDKETDKTGLLREFLVKFKPNKTIAYLYSTSGCETYAENFSEDYGYSTDFYYSNLKKEKKADSYQRFLNNEIDILFATTAFGMGVNIPDIESIVHVQIPNSVEEYYQQVGRGWRRKDVVKECNCLALWSDKNFDKRQTDLENQIYTTENVFEGYKLLLGSAKIKAVGQVVNKDKQALMHSDYNLKLLQYKLEKHNVIRVIGEINGSPLGIKFFNDTPLWSKITQMAKDGFDSFGYVSKALGLHLSEIIKHLYEQDLIGNIKTLPAMKRDIYFEVNMLELDKNIAEAIAKEINQGVEFRSNQLNELKDLFSADNIEEKLNAALS